MCVCMGVCMPACVCLSLCQYPDPNKEAQTEAVCHCPGRTWTTIMRCWLSLFPFKIKLLLFPNFPTLQQTRCSPQAQHRGTYYFSCHHEKSCVTLTSSLKFLLLPFLLNPMRIECAESVTWYCYTITQTRLDLGSIQSSTNVFLVILRLK